jgi:hypothetical protein
MKPHIKQVWLADGRCTWSVEVEWHSVVFCIFTPCFALACCYAATGELQRQWPELRKRVA